MTEKSRESGWDLPYSTEETAPYWEGLKAGELRLPTCRACGVPHFYPRAICPHCGGDDIGWTRASGCGTVYSQTTVHRAPSKAFEEDVPYVVAIVALDEGPHMMTWLVGVDQGRTHIGHQAVMVSRTDGALPHFELVDQA